jgi:flagellar FliL protein
LAAMDKLEELDAAASKAKVEAPSKIKKEAPEATRFEKNYLQLDKELMTNITGSKKVMVVQVALMTHYDTRVFDNVKKHEFALRSAMLDVMRQTTEADVAKPDFRKELATKLKTEVNELLEKFEDFGGIEDVFFTSFVMQ